MQFHGAVQPSIPSMTVTFVCVEAEPMTAAVRRADLCRAVSSGVSRCAFTGASTTNTLSAAVAGAHLVLTTTSRVGFRAEALSRHAHTVSLTTTATSTAPFDRAAAVKVGPCILTDTSGIVLTNAMPAALGTIHADRADSFGATSATPSRVTHTAAIVLTHPMPRAQRRTGSS